MSAWVLRVRVTTLVYVRSGTNMLVLAKFTASTGRLFVHFRRKYLKGLLSIPCDGRGARRPLGQSVQRLLLSRTSRQYRRLWFVVLASRNTCNGLIEARSKQRSNAIWHWSWANSPPRTSSTLWEILGASWNSYPSRLPSSTTS